MKTVKIEPNEKDVSCSGARCLLRFSLGLLLVLNFGAVIATSATLDVPLGYPTVQAAINAAQPGDTVRIAGGTYDESATTTRNGTAEKPIVIDGQGVAIMRQFVLKHSHIHLVNIELNGSLAVYSRRLRMDLDAHFCVVSNNVINMAGVKAYGIQWTGPTSKPFGDADVRRPASDNLIISNRVVNANAYILMSVFGDRNVIHGNIMGETPSGDFFNLWGRSNIISGNICRNNPQGSGNHPDFIQTFGNNGNGSLGHLIVGNLVSGIQGGQLTQLSATGLDTIRDWTFRDNLFVDIALQASCTVPGIKYRNNTFVRCNYGNGGHALNFGTRVFGPTETFNGLTATNSAHGAEVINNLFYDCGDPIKPDRGWYSFSADLANVVANHNFVAKAGYLPVLENALRQVVGSSEGWNNFRWWEANGINGGNPLFLDETKGDFRLQTISPLIGAGLGGVNIGRNWPAGPGADELSLLRLPEAPRGLRIVVD